MIFLQQKNNNKLTIGIDLGTTYSLVATVEKEQPLLLLNNKKGFLLPSVVHYSKKNILVGWDAQKKMIEDPANTISSVKRLIGRSMAFVKKNFSVLPYIIEENKCGGIEFHTNFGVVTPVDVESEILKYFKIRINHLFNQDIYGAVITVPAYFNHLQRMETKKAATIANINVIRLLNEPTAAAIAYGLEDKKKGIIAVYDLGGGTFDISILQLKKGIFEVLATSGDSNLGGDDFDFALAEYIYKKSQLMTPCNDFFQSVLLKTARKTKLSLTKNNIVPVHFFTWKGYINRDEFNAIIYPFIKKTLLICFNTLQDINLETNHIQEVIMVGGSTRIPLVYQKVLDFFQKIPLNSIHPDQVVAIGAATQVNMLMKKNIINKTILLDVVPLSLGIEVMGGFVEKIIHRNTKIPTSKTKEFTTFQDGQTSILIHILQGERESVKDCFSLSHFILKDISSKKAGMVRISVTFEIDAEGLISITASEKLSGVEKKINIDKKIGLYRNNVLKIVEESLHHAKKDYSFRIKEEKKIECNRILTILQEALEKDKNLINKDSLRKIECERKKLKISIEQDDFYAMKKNLKTLEEVSKNFFLLRFQKNLKHFSDKHLSDENI